QGKRLASEKRVKDFVDNRPSFVRLWSNSVWSLDDGPERFDAQLTVRNHNSIENRMVLESFARTLPPYARLTVITDDSGRQSVLGGSPSSGYSIDGRSVDFIVV